MTRFVRLCVVGLLAGVPLAAGGARTLWRIQDGSADVCWSPDLEWPVPCDDDE